MQLPSWLALAQQASLPALSLSALLMAVVAAIRVWPRLRELQNQGDASLRGDLMKRVGELEGRVEYLEKLLSTKEAEHALREQLLRHSLANEESALDAALSMMKINPDRIAEIIEEVKAMREAGRQRIAIEKGAAAGAAVAVSGGQV